LTNNLSYDFFNLNSVDRTYYLNQHFNLLKDGLKTQLGVESFDELGLPFQDEIQRIAGRVVNMSTEEDKLKMDSIGLFNIGEDESSRTYKVKLSTAEAKEFSVFEGEIIVAEGSNDTNSRFNAAKIHKP